MSVVLCGGMFAISITMEVMNNGILIKKLANQGYRYVEYKLSNYCKFSQLLISCIPFINILFSCKKFIDINLNRPILMNESIIAMTEEEKEIYNSNPSVATAISITKDSKIMPNMIFIYNEDNEENIIYFVKNNNNYIITSTKGPISRLKKSKQLELLKINLFEIDRITSNDEKNNNENDKRDSFFYDIENINYRNEENKSKVYVKKYNR